MCVVLHVRTFVKTAAGYCSDVSNIHNIKVFSFRCWLLVVKRLRTVRGHTHTCRSYRPGNTLFMRATDGLYVCLLSCAVWWCCVCIEIGFMFDVDAASQNTRHQESVSLYIYMHGCVALYIY